MPVFSGWPGVGYATEGLGHRVGARQIGMWSVGTVARDRHIDELRVHLPQILVTKAVLLRRAGPEVLPEDVRLRDQFAKDLAALPGFQIEREALHTTIVRFEIRAGQPGQHGRAA